MHRRTGRTDLSSGAAAPPSSAAEARSRIRRLLSSRLGRSDDDLCKDVRVTDILLVTSELCSNALAHGGGIAAFRARFEEGGLALDVADHSFRLPVTRAESSPHLAPGGYGWRLIHRLAGRASVTLCSDGKVVSVWMPLRRPPAESLEASA
ncbi:ATP-binding protein [Streptomyces indicus]|uniref:Anti-sigma regulatory factor (Ser/Thr protein kinase) n=1 Tax=Streptomyces indicus TaxID=417292 RepID=A0A1G8UMZ8_9ACTN|nr:ATP-binding protein [Streptomyces indicus]SDJ55141.1 Anti-sigma regulatory factor (Ser/Thr protein kinase) [Streptomyces indicus]